MRQPVSFQFSCGKLLFAGGGRDIWLSVEFHWNWSDELIATPAGRAIACLGALLISILLRKRLTYLNLAPVTNNVVFCFSNSIRLSQVSTVDAVFSLILTPPCPAPPTSAERIPGLANYRSAAKCACSTCLSACARTILSESCFHLPLFFLHWLCNSAYSLWLWPLGRWTLHRRLHSKTVLRNRKRFQI